MEIDHIEFLNNLLSRVEEFGINLDEATLDHIAYQTISSEEYDQAKLELEKNATLVKEPIVGGRRVGVFRYHTPLRYEDQKIASIELIEPKEGQSVFSGLEHAEYLLPVSLEEFIEKYPNVRWNKDAVNREEFPMLILELTDTMRVKFPRFPILREGE